MTIQFYCPKCKAFIAFDSKHTGKRGRCLTCGQIFIIPSEDYQAPEKIEHPKEPEKAEPLPGFYRAVFIDNWKLFIDPENITTVVFVVAAISFKFFLARGICCVNYISYIVVWGWLLGFYLNIIYETAFELDRLPKIYLGTSITFLGYIIKPLLIFFGTMFVIQLPFLTVLSLPRSEGLTYANIWQLKWGLLLLLQFLFILGLFLFPIAILTTAISKSFVFLRPDYLLRTIIKAFIPYLVVALWLIAAGLLEMQTKQFDQVSIASNAARLVFNLAVQIIAIIAMRSIGLFYRHYKCYLLW